MLKLTACGNRNILILNILLSNVKKRKNIVGIISIFFYIISIGFLYNSKLKKFSIFNYNILRGCCKKFKYSCSFNFLRLSEKANKYVHLLELNVR